MESPNVLNERTDHTYCSIYGAPPKKVTLDRKVIQVTPRKNCAECNETFKTNKSFDRHIQQVHDVDVCVEVLQFAGKVEFDDWRCSVQEADQSIYIKSHVVQLPNNVKLTYYTCKQSYRAKNRLLPEKDRKKKPRMKGYCSTKNHCPARIKTTEFPDDTIVVEYCKTHFGHEIEKTRLRIPSPEKILASEIQEIVSMDYLLEKCREAASSQPCRSLLISRKNLDIIKRRHADSQENGEKCLEDASSKINEKLEKNAPTHYIVENDVEGDSELLCLTYCETYDEPEENSIGVEYCETHFVHEIEQKRLRIPSAEIMQESDMQEFVSVDYLLEKCREAASGQSSRSLVISRKNLDSILRQYAVSQENVEKCEDVSSKINEKLQKNVGDGGSWLRCHTYCKTGKEPQENLTPDRKVIQVTPEMNCVKCDKTFITNKSFDRHIKQIHNVDVRVEVLQFAGKVEFDYWRCSVQEAGQSRYTLSHVVELPNKVKVTYYTCKQSHRAKSRLLPQENRKKEPRMKGFCRTKNHCPARIKTTELTDGTIGVEYCKTHFGHEIERLRIPSQEKIQTSEIPEIVSMDYLLEKCHEAASSKINEKLQKNVGSGLRSHPYSKTNEEPKEKLTPVKKVIPAIPKMNCGECGGKYLNNKSFDKHMKQVHDVDIRLETLEFKDREAFDNWRSSLEEADRSNYNICKSVRSADKAKFSYYSCNRSHRNQSLIPAEVRRRAPSLKGSCPTVNHCPARIACKEFPDGTIRITYTRTHFGHDFDLRHLRITHQIKDQLVAAMQENVPANVILEKCRQAAGGQPNRLQIISRTDLANIKRQYGIGQDYASRFTKEKTNKFKRRQKKVPTKLSALWKSHKQALQMNCIITQDFTNDVWTVQSLNNPSESHKIRLKTTSCTCEKKFFCRKCDTCSCQYECSCADSVVRSFMCRHIHHLCLGLGNMKDNVSSASDGATESQQNLNENNDDETTPADGLHSSESDVEPQRESPEVLQKLFMENMGQFVQTIRTADDLRAAMELVKNLSQTNNEREQEIPELKRRTKNTERDRRKPYQRGEIQQKDKKECSELESSTSSTAEVDVKDIDFWQIPFLHDIQNCMI